MGMNPTAALCDQELALNTEQTLECLYRSSEGLYAGAATGVQNIHF